ncbi:MAG: SLC13 family permease, partial [Promethearchaeota archaeon]
MELVPVVVVLMLMALTILFFSKESVDFVAVGIISATVAGITLAAYRGWDLQRVFVAVEFQPLIFIFGMSVIAYVAERERIFQVFAIVLIKATKGNERFLFYTICVVSTLAASFLADVTVAIIFVPIIVRTCQILKIRAGTYLMGMTITINLGSLITPFSSGENILIATYFDLSLGFFLQNFTLLFAILMLATLVLMDFFFLRKEPRGPLENKLLLLEILNPDLVIVNKRSFYKNTVAIMTIFSLMVFISASYLVVLVGAMILILINKLRFKDIFKKVEWDILFFLMCLMIIIGALTELGLMTLLGDGILE